MAVREDDHADMLPGDPDSTEVRINTMLALSRLAIVLDTDEDKDNLKILQDAIPQMVAVLKQAVDEGNEDRTTQSFEVSPSCECGASSRFIY